MCLLVYAVGLGLARTGSTWFASLTPPPASSANPLAAPHVALAFALLGVAGWRIWWRIGPGTLLRVWGWQVLGLALWAPCLFGLHSLSGSLLIALPSLILTLTSLVGFARRDGWAASMMVPTLFWIGYATYLAAGTWWLNG